MSALLVAAGLLAGANLASVALLWRGPMRAVAGAVVGVAATAWLALALGSAGDVIPALLAVQLVAIVAPAARAFVPAPAARSLTRPEP